MLIDVENLFYMKTALKTACIIFIISHLIVRSVDSHSCASCDRSRCQTPTNCAGGTTQDACGCCLACARLANETCGGKFGLLGECDQGLVCLLKIQSGQPITGNEEGICKEPQDACSSLHHYSGCNKVDMQCMCNTISTCEDPFFEHKTRLECEATLARLLVEESESDGCENVECPVGEVCPDDSYKLPKLVVPNKCCGVSDGCACLPCPPPECQEGFQVKLEQQAENKPGKCCAVYKCVNETEFRCKFEGQYFPNGHTWKKNKCLKCDCKDGLTFCETAECKPLPDCGRIEIPEGECCPLCIGCVTSIGRFYNNTERWKEDDCTSCECENGQVHCQAEMCHSACPHPVKIPGQCCSVCPDHTQTEVTLPPDCPSIDNCSIQCAAGLKKNENGCYECKCKLEDCNLSCLNGYSQDVNGQEICQCAQEESDCQRLTDCKKYCNHGHRLDKNGCPTCKCRSCKKLKGCNLKCPAGFQTDDRECPICKCKAADISTTISTTPVSMVTTIRSVHLSEEATCYSSEGQQYDEGETWHDGCRYCYCHGGQEMCALISCPVPTCEHPSVTADDCCPQCLDDTSAVVPVMTVCQAIDGHHYIEGETWNMDSCTRCICHEGRVLCNTQQCSPTPCSNPVKKLGECCASCTGLIAEPAHSDSNTNKPPCYSDDGRTAYQHGNSWRASICQSCTCQHGKIKCFSDSCPKPTCERPVLRKNQCCPICLDKKASRCENEDRIYNNGEKWNPSECVHCMCLNGRIKCTEKQCSVDCDNPIHIEGKCCPVCAGKIPKRTDTPVIPKLEKSTPVITYLDDNDGFPGEEDGTFKIHTHPPQLSLMAVIVCCVIVLVLLVIISLLLCLLFKQRRQLRYKEQELKIARLKPRPKSTNLEFQGGMMPFLSSNGSVCLEKNKCANENEYTKPYMAPVNTYVAPVKNVV